MQASFTARYALCIFGALAFLAGCGGNAGGGAPLTFGSPALRNTPLKGKTFFFTGRSQSFRVPSAVYSITVVMRGAAGPADCKGAVGRGGRVTAVIPVLPHQKLWVYVGGQGHGQLGGFNGGANAASDLLGGGGGASDVRASPGRLTDRILVAGGAGGGGWPNGFYTFSCAGEPGYGGGLVAGAGGLGFNYYANGGGGGGGGTQAAGGAGGPAGSPSTQYHRYPGKEGRIGEGGSGGRAVGYGGGGGGGGGGYYGGGGGGSGSSGPGSLWGGGGGGGGGSSYAEPSAARVQFWQNWKNATGDGLVVFSWR
ncbi:MAG: hypothetical protein JO350_04915 [Candidatus Eremiobacteraeota bacterium]|nr:hypothetical protein [Candidatus Eremiobacteraeota bacterium]